jgi:DNA-binding transcriptional LysR family regulator
VLLPWLDAFQQLHPRVEIRLQLSDRVANIYSEPVDVALRYGKPPPCTWWYPAAVSSHLWCAACAILWPIARRSWLGWMLNKNSH